MTSIKSMKIVNIELAEGTLVPVVTVTTDSGLVGVGPGFEHAIRNVVIEELAEDWKIANRIAGMSLVDLVNKYGICVTNEVYTKWKDVPYVDNGEFKFLPVMNDAYPILLSDITNCSDGDNIKVKAVFNYRDQVYKYQVSNVGELMLQVANDVYGHESVAKRAKNKQTITELMEVFSIVAARNLQPIHLFNKSFTTFIGEAYRLAGIELKGTKQPMKPTKLGRITLQDIEQNTNKDWMVTLTIENEIMTPFNIKYVVTSCDNTDNPLRCDSIHGTCTQIFNSLPLTLEKEKELRTVQPLVFRDYFELVVNSSLRTRAFPKNGHGAQMLGLIDWFGKGPTKDCIDYLLEVMFDPERTWSPETQGVKNVTGKAEGGEVAFRISHAVGNHYVEGTLETVKVRIFKNHSSIQTYIHPQEGTWPNDPVTYNINHKDDFENHLRGIVKAEVFNRNNKSK